LDGLTPFISLDQVQLQIGGQGREKSVDFRNGKFYIEKALSRGNF